MLFINNINQAVEFSSVQLFADDTNLLLIKSSLKKVNKHTNRDLKSDSHIPENICHIKIVPRFVRKNTIICLFGV